MRGHPDSPLSMLPPHAAADASKNGHHLPKGRELAEAEVNRLADLVMAWIERDLINHPVR